MNLAGDSVRSIERALDLLEALAASGGRATLTELTQRTALSLPTTHRLLRTLQSRGYLHRERGRAYVLGARNIVTGTHASRLLREHLDPHLREIVTTIGESAYAAVQDHDGILCVAHVPSPHSAPATTRVGQRFDCHATASGKAILAELTDDEVRSITAPGLPSLTSETVTDVAVLLTQLDLVRRDGYAVSRGEEKTGTWSIAVTIPGLSAALAVTGPEARMAELDPSFVADLLEHITKRIAADFSER
jgi:IclR family acetate operon transcriptional repressor